MRYHLIPARMAINKKSTNNKYWRGCGEKKSLWHYWWECKLVQPLRKTVWKFLQKLKIWITIWSNNPILGHLSEKTMTQKDTCTPVYMYWSIISNSQDMDANLNSIDRQKDKKMWYRCTMEYYKAIKRKKEWHLQQHRWT